MQGNKFSGVLQFPEGGTFTQGGVVYDVEVKHCNQTNPYELFDATIDFDKLGINTMSDVPWIIEEIFKFGGFIPQDESMENGKKKETDIVS